jgi:hypothetical protein
MGTVRPNASENSKINRLAGKLGKASIITPVWESSGEPDLVRLRPDLNIETGI